MITKGHLFFKKLHVKVYLRRPETAALEVRTVYDIHHYFCRTPRFVSPAPEYKSTATIPACVSPLQRELTDFSSDTTSHTANKIKHYDVLSQVSQAFFFVAKHPLCELTQKYPDSKTRFFALLCTFCYIQSFLPFVFLCTCFAYI